MANFTKKETNIHKGHRKRVRKKYLLVGPEAFEEHELLELLLFYAFKQVDTNEIAHRLISIFGSIGGVLSASIDELMAVEGVGESTAVLISVIDDIMKISKAEEDNKKPLNTSEEMYKFIEPFFKDMRTEMVLGVALDEQLKVIRVTKVYEGSFDTVALPIAKIVRSFVACGASAVFLAHNHPSGIAIPSVADIKTTNRLKLALESVGIQFVDHIIVGADDYVSFKDSSGKLYSISE